MIALSTDDAPTLQRFRASLQAPYHFVADDEATLTRRFDVKMWLVSMARRTTFVVGRGRRILSVEEGGAAIDPSGAVKACSLRPPAAMQFLIGPPDAGAVPTP